METSDPQSEAPIGLRGHRIRDIARAEQRRYDILVSAIHAFAARGYQAASMGDIAAEARIAKSHIYHYFRNKEHIFVDIRTTAVQRSIDELQEIVAAGDTPEATLRRALHCFIAGLFDPIDQFSAVLADPPDLSPENHRRIRELQHHYERMFESILARGIEAGEFVDGNPKLMMFTVLRAALGVPLWYRPAGSWTPEWIAEQVTEQLVRSVRASPADSPAQD